MTLALALGLAAHAQIVTQRSGASSPLDSNGNLGIGTTVPNYRLVVNSNTNNLAALPLQNTGMAVAEFAGPDSVDSRILLDTFNGEPLFTTRRANGTAASPSAVLSGNNIGGWSAYGYGATTYGANGRVNFLATATENWTDTAQGTNFNVWTTLNGGIVKFQRFTIDNTGFVGIGTTTPATVLELDQNIGQTAGRHDLAVFTRTTPGSNVGAVRLGYYSDGTNDIGGNVRSGGSLPLYLGTAAADQALTILNAGNVGIGNINPGQMLTVNGFVQVLPTTVASLGTCNTAAEGTYGAVTNALSPTFLGIVAGGGSVHAPVYCNGTNWIVH